MSAAFSEEQAGNNGHIAIIDLYLITNKNKKAFAAFTHMEACFIAGI